MEVSLVSTVMPSTFFTNVAEPTAEFPEQVAEAVFKDQPAPGVVYEYEASKQVALIPVSTLKVPLRVKVHKVSPLLLTPV